MSQMKAGRREECYRGAQPSCIAGKLSRGSSGSTAGPVHRNKKEVKTLPLGRMRYNQMESDVDEAALGKLDQINGVQEQAV